MSRYDLRIASGHAPESSMTVSGVFWSLDDHGAVLANVEDDDGLVVCRRTIPDGAKITIFSSAPGNWLAKTDEPEIRALLSDTNLDVISRDLYILQEGFRREGHVRPFPPLLEQAIFAVG